MKKNLSRPEAAEYLGVSLITLDRALRQRKIRHFKIGRRVMVSIEQLNEFLALCERKPEPASENSRGASEANRYD